MIDHDVTAEDLHEKSPAKIEGFVQPVMIWDMHKEMSEDWLQNEINVCAMSVFKSAFLSRLQEDKKIKFFAEYNQTLIEGLWDNNNFDPDARPDIRMAIKTRFPACAPDITEEMILVQSFYENCQAFSYETENYGWESKIGETIKANDRPEYAEHESGRKLRLLDNLLYLTQAINLQHAKISYTNV